MQKALNPSCCHACMSETADCWRLQFGAKHKLPRTELRFPPSASLNTITCLQKDVQHWDDLLASHTIETHGFFHSGCSHCSRRERLVLDTAHVSPGGPGGWTDVLDHSCLTQEQRSTCSAIKSSESFKQAVSCFALAGSDHRIMGCHYVSSLCVEESETVCVFHPISCVLSSAPRPIKGLIVVTPEVSKKRGWRGRL